MKEKMKRSISLALAALLVICSMQITAFADENAHITLGSNTSVDEKIEDASDVAFTYYVEMNGKAVNGTYIGSDGNNYTAVNGNITFPYNVTVEIPAENGDTYSVYRYEYDNAKYALIEQSGTAKGSIDAFEYYYSVDGTEVSLTAEEFNAATNNGENLSVNKFVTRDDDGNIANAYDETEAMSITGYDVVRSTGTSTTYSLAETTHYYLPSSLDTYNFQTDLDIVFSSVKIMIATTYTYTYTLTGQTNYPISEDIDLTSATGSGTNTTNSEARSSAKSAAETDIGRYAYRVTVEAIHADTGKTAILASDILTDADNENWKGSEDQSYSYSSDVYAFTELEPVTYEYGQRESTTNRDILFEAAVSPAPTGTFVVDYAVIDDTTTLPIASEDAAFTIKDADGNPLTEGEDYTFSTNSCSLTILTYSIGCMEYVFSDIPAGTYTVTQTAAPQNYTIDASEYQFTVDRKTGSVAGDGFAVSSWNSGYTALTNNKWSILSLYSFNIFKNGAFSLAFSNLDQYNDPVYDKSTPSGSTFIMIDRAAAVDMLTTLVSNGYTSLGDLDLTELIQDVTNLDFSSLDIDMIVELIALIAKYAPDLFSEITIPAILTSTTASDGTVTFNSSSNVLNTVGALLGLTGNIVDAATLATILESVLGSIVSEDILKVLVTILNAADISSITISTGMPESTYLLYESAVPGGYELGDNLIGDTIYVSSDGTAYAYTGAVVRGAAELIEQYLNIDLSKIFITSDAFNEFLGNTYDSYEEYIAETVQSLADIVIGIFEQLGYEFSEEQLESIDALVNSVAQGVIDGTINSNEVLTKLVDGISEILGYTEDWFNPTVVDESYVIVNNIYEGLVTVSVTDCQGNEIEDAEYSVTDGDGNPVVIEEGGSILVYNTYTLTVASVSDGYVLDEDLSTFDIFISESGGSYSLKAVYHLKTEKEEVAATRSETGMTAGTVCAYCDTVFSGCEEIPALGVNIMVNGSDLGTVALNGSNVSNETVNVKYASSYTLTAEANEGCTFIGWYSNGKIVSEKQTYTTAAYADTAYTPLFEETETVSFSVTFVDKYSNVITTLSSEEIASLESMPDAPVYKGLKFSAWTMTLDEIKALTGDAIVTALYVSDDSGTYTVTAENCSITINGVTTENMVSGVVYDSKVTVTPISDTASIWNINDATVGYGNTFTFYCGSDITITYGTDAVINEVPTVSIINTARGSDYKVSFLATRSVPEAYTLLESGFVYGKAMTEDDLILENVGTVQGTSNGMVKKITNSDLSRNGQFALSYGVSAMDENACARAYLIYSDATGATNVIYSNAVIYEYQAD